MSDLWYIIQRPNPFVLSILYKSTASLSKGYKSFLLCPLIWIFIFLRMLPCACEHLITFVCFSSIDLCPLNFQTQPRNLRVLRKTFFPYNDIMHLSKMCKARTNSSVSFGFWSIIMYF